MKLTDFCDSLSKKTYGWVNVVFGPHKISNVLLVLMLSHFVFSVMKMQ